MEKVGGLEGDLMSSLEGVVGSAELRHHGARVGSGAYQRIAILGAAAPPPPLPEQSKLKVQLASNLENLPTPVSMQPDSSK